MMAKSLKLIIEAFLFASDKPLSASEIRPWLPDETASNITQTLKDLQAEYDSLERSFILKEVAQGFQLRTRTEYAPYVLKMLRTSPTRLSRAALETLAIIAYKQPILRQEIERLRGVDVGKGPYQNHGPKKPPWQTTYLRNNQKVSCCL